MSRIPDSYGDAEVDRLLAGAGEVIAGVRYCWLVTQAQGGGVAARPMGRVPPDAGEDRWRIRFVTDGRSRKASDIRHAARVEVIFQHDSDDAYVALFGRAVLQEDASEVRRRWKRAYDPYFPGEQDRANAVFLQIDVERIEAWIRGVTPEPFGLRATVLERDAAGAWRLSPGPCRAA